MSWHPQCHGSWKRGPSPEAPQPLPIIFGPDSPRVSCPLCPPKLALMHQTAPSPQALAQASPLGGACVCGVRSCPVGFKVPCFLHRTSSGFPDQPGLRRARQPVRPLAELGHLLHSAGGPAHFLPQHSTDVFAETSLWRVDHPVTAPLTLTLNPKSFSWYLLFLSVDLHSNSEMGRPCPQVTAEERGARKRRKLLGPRAPAGQGFTRALVAALSSLLVFFL